MNKPVSLNSPDTAEARARDSLFLLAEISFEDAQQSHKVKVRNLSAGGMMIESDLEVSQGQRVVAVLRNIGPVKGQVAWARSERFGVAFDRAIDPKLARKPVGNGPGTPRYLRSTSATAPSFPR